MSNKPKFAVFGGGSWATAIVKMLCENLNEVGWYMRSTSALEKATTAFRPQYELACAAAGIEKVEDANLDTMIQVVEDAGIKLAAVPRGQQTGTGEEEANFSDFDPHSNDVYTTP